MVTIKWCIYRVYMLVIKGWWQYKTMYRWKYDGINIMVAITWCRYMYDGNNWMLVIPVQIHVWWQYYNGGNTTMQIHIYMYIIAITHGKSRCDGNNGMVAITMYHLIVTITLLPSYLYTSCYYHNHHIIAIIISGLCYVNHHIIAIIPVVASCGQHTLSMP